MSKFHRWLALGATLLLAMAVLAPACAKPAPTPTPKATPTAAATPTPVPVKPMTVRVSSYGGPTYAPRQYQERWMKAIEERSGGRLKFEFFPSESLVKLTDAWDAIGKGVVEAGSMGLYAPEKQGILEAIALMPFNWKYDKFLDHYKDPGGFYDWVEPMWEKRGNLKLIMWSAQGGFEFAGRTEKNLLKTKEDFKGQLVRGLPALKRPLELLGASPVEVATADVYTALQRSTIDVSMHSLDAIESNKFYEVGPYITVANLTSSYLMFVMNLDFYKSLPPELRAIVDQTTLDTDQWYKGVINDLVDSTRKRLEANPKVRIYVVSDAERARWKEAMKPYYDELAKKFGDDWQAFQKVWATVQ